MLQQSIRRNPLMESACLPPIIALSINILKEQIDILYSGWLFHVKAVGHKGGNSEESPYYAQLNDI
jgi:hypothetical protein